MFTIAANRATLAGVTLALVATVGLGGPGSTGATAAAPAAASYAAGEREPVARPTLQRIPDGLKGHPFMGMLRVPKGYVQEEFLVSGIARPYGGPAVLADGSVPADTSALPPAPYTARIVVVRPTGTTKSNGAGVVTWHNVTFAHDIGEWFNIGREVVANGWTYVEASVQPASMPALKAFDPVRYASVELPGDAYSYDIYSQVGQAVRSGDATAGRPLRDVVAIGASQSGSALNNYLRSVQPRYEPVYDGFIVAVSNGPDFHSDVPVLRLLSEGEVDGSSASPDARNYRQWEITGSAHGAHSDFLYIGAQEERDLGFNLVDAVAGDDAPFGTQSCMINRFPMWQAHDAALAAMATWIRKGKAPAVQPRLRVVDGKIKRDKVGNGIGGIRLPAMAVPRAAYNRTGDCLALNGRTEPFSAKRLKSLYPTRKVYAKKLAKAVRRSVKAGVLTPSDAATVRP